MNIEIANRLLDLRKKSGLSQEDLADKLGLSRQAVSKWERAEASPDTDNLICLTKIYGVSIDDLLKTDVPVEDIAKQVKEENKDKTIHVDLNDEHIIIETNCNGKHIHNCSESKDRVAKALEGLFTLLCVVAYLFVSFVWGHWEITWIIFLAIPILTSLVEAFRKRNGHKFAYPVLMAAVFLLLGFGYIIPGQHLWHPGWIVFITIPVYYGICGVFVKEDKDDND